MGFVARSRDSAYVSPLADSSEGGGVSRFQFRTSFCSCRRKLNRLCPPSAKVEAPSLEALTELQKRALSLILGALCVFLSVVSIRLHNARPAIEYAPIESGLASGEACIEVDDSLCLCVRSNCFLTLRSFVRVRFGLSLTCRRCCRICRRCSMRYSFRQQS